MYLYFIVLRSECGVGRVRTCMSAFHCGYGRVIITSCLHVVNLCAARWPTIGKNKLKLSCNTKCLTAKPLSCTKIISMLKSKVKLSYFFISNYCLKYLFSIHSKIMNFLNSVTAI